MCEPLIVANCSGFYGDRFEAAEEVVRGGPVHVLTGDYLAELTMAILQRGRAKNPGAAGYVPTFLRQMERVLGECVERGIRVVSNAGGLNPRALAEQLEALAAKLGLRVRVAYVDGDDLMPRLDELRARGEPLAHMERGTALWNAGLGPVLSANAYFGAWGIAEALARGADVVVTGRVTDASLVVGPAAWHFGWKRDDWDRLAGAVVAGHVIECGPQCTGGNYSFFEEVRSFERIGFPLAEVYEDGSCVITKHPGTGGAVTVGTVTAQLLYEIRSPAYANPDVVARFDTVRVEQAGEDRVRCHGARGEPPPETAKVCVNVAGGYKNAMTLLLSGLDVAEKARTIEQTLVGALGGRERFASLEVRRVGSVREDPGSVNEALTLLRVTATSPDAERVGRGFSARVVELITGNVPGLGALAPPDDAAPYAVHWPALIPAALLEQRVVVGGEVVRVPAKYEGSREGVWRSAAEAGTALRQAPGSGATVRVPLGRVFGTRSGDKGGDANVGVWARSDEAWEFLRGWLSAERFVALVPDAAGLGVERYEFSNLRALNFYVRGFLGDGAAASTKVDPQAKTLGEFLRARWIDVPASLAPGSRDATAR